MFDPQAEARLHSIESEQAVDRGVNQIAVTACGHSP
jgi:hypothetical protein